ncbi:MAG: hypothetical protein E6G47_12915, partial [Actinobacteria bacterium]
EGRQFPLILALRSVLEAQKNKADALARETGEIIPWLFFRRNGEPIKDLYGAWDRACRTAGVAGLVPHDLRRSAVRNLERAGVPRATAMKLVGPQDRSHLSPLRDRGRVRPSCGRRKARRAPPESRPRQANRRSIPEVALTQNRHNFAPKSPTNTLHWSNKCLILN